MTDNIPAIVYRKFPDYKNEARRLSKMSREELLLSKAIKRTMKPPKAKYSEPIGGGYNVGNNVEKSKHLPKEWR